MRIQLGLRGDLFTDAQDGDESHENKNPQTSMDWFKGKFTGNNSIFHGKIYGFRLRFSQQNLSIDIGNFRILKWRYVSTIFLAIFSGDIPLHRPKK
jgi:hypothetical protein